MGQRSLQILTWPVSNDLACFKEDLPIAGHAGYAGRAVCKKFAFRNKIAGGGASIEVEAGASRKCVRFAGGTP